MHACIHASCSRKGSEPISSAVVLAFVLEPVIELPDPALSVEVYAWTTKQAGFGHHSKRTWVLSCHLEIQ